MDSSPTISPNFFIISNLSHPPSSQKIYYKSVRRLPEIFVFRQNPVALSSSGWYKGSTCQTNIFIIKIFFSNVNTLIFTNLKPFAHIKTSKCRFSPKLSFLFVENLHLSYHFISALFFPLLYVTSDDVPPYIHLRNDNTDIPCNHCSQNDNIHPHPD